MGLGNKDNSLFLLGVPRFHNFQLGLMIMSNFFNTFNAASSKVTLAKEPSLAEKIQDAVKRGHMVVSLPWGGNPKPKKDGNESKWVLMTQKGPIVDGPNGVFGSIRAEGFILWMPPIEDEEGNVIPGHWEFPTSHRRGDAGDEPIPGAKASGFHKLILGIWKLKARALAEEYKALGEKDKAKDLLTQVSSLGIEAVFGKQFNFNIPGLTSGDLMAMKAEGLAIAQAEGRKADKAKMVYNIILAIDINYSEDDEISIVAREVIENRAPLMTIPQGGKEILPQNLLLEAMMLEVEEEMEKAQKLASLDAKAANLISKGGKNAGKKEVRRKLEALATKIGVSYQAIESFYKAKKHPAGIAEAMKASPNPTKEEVEAFLVGEEYAKENKENTVSPEASVQKGAEAQEKKNTLLNQEKEEEIDPNLLDTEV